MQLDTLDLLGDIAATTGVPAPIAEKKVSEPKPTRKRTTSSGILNFDLETVPDYERRELFELDEVPAPSKRATMLEVAEITKTLEGTIPSVVEWLQKNNFADALLDSIEAAERKLAKPRKGILDAIADLRKQDETREALVASQRKTMSCSPEMCRIVAFGWSVDSGIQNSLVVGVDGVTETEILHTFWSLAKQSRSVCGFNILGFDLPVIFTRSILLDVAPSRAFDLKPWGTDVIDLMAKRFPKGPATGLKKLCRLLGIPVPAEGVDGSQTEELFKNDPAKLGEYVRSDVFLVEELYQRYRGFFC